MASQPLELCRTILGCSVRLGLFAGTETTDLPIAPKRDGNESTSHATDDVATITGSSAASSPNTSVGPADILPILHASLYRKISTGNRQRGFTAILTSTPYKQGLNKMLTESGSIQSKATKRPAPKTFVSSLLTYWSFVH